MIGRRAAVIYALLTGGTLLGGAATVLTRGNDASSDQLEVAPLQRGEIAVVLIASTTCVPSQNPALSGAFASVVEELRSEAAARELSFRTIAVVRSPSPGEGIAFLSRFAQFDEIIVGGSRWNTGLRHFILERHPSAMVTPQVVVVVREFSQDRQSIVSEVIALRRSGVATIAGWARAGAPIPATFFLPPGSK